MHAPSRLQKRNARARMVSPKLARIVRRKGAKGATRATLVTSLTTQTPSVHVRVLIEHIPANPSTRTMSNFGCPMHYARVAIVQ